MSTRINPYQGTWDKVEEIKQSQAEKPSFLKANKETIKAASKIAFLVIGSIVAAGLMLHLNVNAITQLSQLERGGALLFIDALIGGAIFYMRDRNTEDAGLEVEDHEEPSTYRIVSWNVATLRDYSNMCFINNKIQDGTQFSDAYNELLTGAPYRASEEEKASRVELFQQAFKQFGNPGVILLQESWQMSPGQLKAILPEGYSAFSYEYGVDSKNCTVIWDASKFSKINHANIFYDPEYIVSSSSSLDTIVLLKDNTNGTTLCVGSAHLRGFSLAYDTFDEEFKTKELRKAKAGDNQTRYDLKTMDAVQAELYIFAGDFNVTAEHYPARLNIIRNDYGYLTDTTDISPTIYDANLKEEDGITPKPAKLDHIYAKGGEGIEVQIKSTDLQRTPLSNFKRPSDHLPIGAEISYSRKKVIEPAKV